MFLKLKKNVYNLLLFCLLANSNFAQSSFTKQYTLTYKTETKAIPNGTQEYGFSPDLGFWNFEDQQAYFQFSIPTKNNTVHATLANVSTSPLTQKELTFINTSRIKTSFELTSTINAARFDKHLFAKINAIRFNTQTNTYEKLTSFDIIYQTSNTQKLSTKAFGANSVLGSGSGKWYKISVAKSGLYKLDYNAFVDLGIVTTQLNSNAINVYGNHTSMLSKDNSVPRVDDLIKNSIFVVDGGDGTFDANDYLVFYATDAHKVVRNGDFYEHVTNNYTDSSYYYINIDPNSTPKRIQPAIQTSSTTNQVISSFNDFKFIEPDLYSLNNSGQEWFGDIYDVQLSNTYNFEFSNSSNDTARLRAGMVLQSSSSAPYFDISTAGNSLNVKSNSSSGTGYLASKGNLVVKSIKFKNNSDQPIVSITFNKAGFPSSKGYLDFLEFNAMRNLKMTGSQMEFSHLKSIQTGNITEFQLSDAQDVTFIWEITNPTDARLITSNGSTTKSFKVQMDSLRRFVASTGDLFYTPTLLGKIENQNLHGIGYFDMIIISAPEFLQASERLATFHTSEGTSTVVVTQQQIFNEFSSGMRDPTAIRHFLKMFYDRANGDPNLVPKYCLLMGDCSYDYRNRLSSNSDYVITYESDASLQTTSTYATDDYFAILGDSEAMNSTDLIDISIGRLPVETLEDANNLVDKIIRYSTQNLNSSTAIECTNGQSNSIYRDWRNIMLLVSDDGDNNAYFDDVEIMYTKITGTHKELNINKIHIDSYLETVTPGGERYIGATAALKNRVQRGALLVNYIGHGGETGWAHEEILNVPTIQNWTNNKAMPIFMTATCEFSRYDDHDRVSAGEYVLLNPNGGGIGLFTTTRLVFSSSNEKLTKFFYDTIADFVNGKPQTLGQIYQGTKNKFALSNSGNDFRKFALLGDPAVQLAIPYYHIKTDSIDGIDINVYTDTIKALSTVTISGHLEDNSGQKLTNYNGVIYPTIYDKKSQLTTLGNSSDSYAAPFEMWKNIAYKGKASVVNGEFNFTFIIPKDISYDIGVSRFSFYATDETVKDANGYTESVLIGGINPNASSDNVGPTVSLYLNSEKFVNGGITNTSPVLLATIFDNNGINTVGNGIGHNIEVRLDNNSETFILNDYYESDLDTYKSGKINYELTDLEPGEHTLHFKVWDTYNNSTDEDLTFTVVAETDIEVKHLLNYPNPFTTQTEFSFEHNQVCDYLDVQLQIFTVTGKIVKNIQQRIHSDGFRIDGIKWDGRDDFGERIGIGTYVYKLSVTTESGKNLEKFEKLVILN